MATLIKKLQMKPGQRAIIVNAPDRFGYNKSEIPERVQLLDKPSGKFDYLHLFVADKSELDKFLPEALELIEYDAVFWISYPKGTSGLNSDINRDKLWTLMEDTGLRPVRAVSIDETWSALRFRPSELVKSYKS